MHLCRLENRSRLKGRTIYTHTIYIPCLHTLTDRERALLLTIGPWHEKTLTVACKQHMHRPICAYQPVRLQSNQSNRFWYWLSQNYTSQTCSMQNVNILAILGSSADQIVPYLLATPLDGFSRIEAHIYIYSAILLTLCMLGNCACLFVVYCLLFFVFNKLFQKQNHEYH